MIVGPEAAVAGKGELFAWWTAYFQHVKAGTRMALTIKSSRLVHPDVAVIDVLALRDDLGDVAPRVRGTWLVVNGGQSWKVAACACFHGRWRKRTRHARGDHIGLRQDSGRG